MSSASFKTSYKSYFQKLLFFVISFLFILLEQSHAQCTTVSNYDRIVSGYHSTLAVETDGNIAYWGEWMAEGQDVTAPLDFSKPGITPIMGTIGGGMATIQYTTPYDQAIFLTSDGLYAVGKVGKVLPAALTPAPNLGNLAKILPPTGGGSNGLPIGIAVTDVASIFATYNTLLIVTKNENVSPRDGSVWIITQTTQAVEANGGAANDVASSSWKKVMINIGTPLTNITAARGQVSYVASSAQYNSAFIALAANGDVYTWGNTTYLGNAAVTAKVYATKMFLPAEFSSTNIPKMIGVTGGTKNLPRTAKNTYYLLSNSGSLYALGDNSKKQCGDFSTIERTSWVPVQSSSTTNFTNINFISVQEHTSGIPCASAITTDGKLYTWGEDDEGMLGRTSDYQVLQVFDPGIASGSVGSTAIFSEMGGHTLMYLKVGSDKFCYVGHKTGGSMGDGFASAYLISFECSATPSISICGSIPVAPVVNSSTITALPTSIVANGSSTSTITVQLKDVSNNNLTTSGGVVVITSDAGTISATVDNYDGTYTAILTSPLSATAVLATLGFSVSGVISTITPASVEFTPIPAPSTPGSITGTTLQCPSTSAQMYSIDPVANAATYTWAVPTGWRITAGQGTNSITVTIDSSGQTGDISVFATNIAGSSNSSLLTITVPAFNSILLSSAASSNSQTSCINTAITPITYTTTGATGATFSGLPIGVTGAWAANVVTISGIPSVARAALTYTVTLTGGCGVITTTGTVAVKANNTVVRTSNVVTTSQTVCINIAITPITYTTTGATGATFSGLPSGVTGSWADSVVTISGAPTVAGTALTYTVTLTGGCGVVTTTGTIAVTANNTITLSSAVGTETQIKCINTAITNITYSTTGATGASITGLPAGVTGIWANNIITLSGSSTLAGSFIYTISLLGGCSIPDHTGEINVTPDNTISLFSTAATDSQSVCIGAGISTIEYSSVGSTGSNVTGLPAGLQVVDNPNKVIISGTPTVEGVFNYTILLQGGCGLISKNGTVSIHSLPTGTIAASNNGIICEGSTVLLTATGGNSYQWYFNANLIAGVVADSYSASLPGVYSVKLISDKGCTSIVQNTPTLILNKTPIVCFDFDKYCINTPINFTNKCTINLSGPISILWDFGDNTNASIESPTHSFLDEKTYAVKLTITPTNCPLLEKSVSKNIQIEIPPAGIKYPTVYALINNNTQLSARASGKIYSWSPSIGLNNSSIQAPTFNYTAPLNYGVQITNEAGCVYRDSVNVLLFDKADFFVPKAFSPNNDGHNDKLLFAMPGMAMLSYFRIFNRWGNLVFETTNVNITWDGIFRGVAQPSEAYSWFAEGISNLGNKIQRNGQTLILR